MNFSISRKIIQLGFLAFLMLFAAGCIPVAPSEELVVGKWEEYQNYCEMRTASACAKLEFFSNGTFIGRNIPMDLFVWSSEFEAEIEGTWRFIEPRGTIWDDHPILLEFPPLPEAPWADHSRIYLAKDGEHIFVGVDADTHFFKVNG